MGDLELPDELEPLSERVIHAQKVSWQELPSLIATADVNLAPLEPTLFNEAKSENKWTEAALVGVPTVASDFGAFASAIEDGRTGLLCSTREGLESACCASWTMPTSAARSARARSRTCARAA